MLANHLFLFHLFIYLLFQDSFNQYMYTQKFEVGFYKYESR